jgi:vacuolar-type H+-ATPase subunit F/Vma7
MEIVAVGEPEFSLGFEVAGVRCVVAEGQAAEPVIDTLMAEQSVGILVVSQRTFDRLSADLRERMLRAPRPVTVVLSEQDSNEELRSMIIRSIGVDLWKSEE